MKSLREEFIEQLEPYLTMDGLDEIVNPLIKSVKERDMYILGDEQAEEIGLGSELTPYHTKHFIKERMNRTLG